MKISETFHVFWYNVVYNVGKKKNGTYWHKRKCLEYFLSIKQHFFKLFGLFSKRFDQQTAFLDSFVHIKALIY